MVFALFVRLLWLSPLVCVVKSDRNITVTASNPAIIYSPAGAWSLVSSQSARTGDRARITASKGASVSLIFKGIAVYCRTLWSETPAVLELTLDGKGFDFDRGSGPFNSSASVALWGACWLQVLRVRKFLLAEPGSSVKVPLEDSEHTIKVTHSDAEGHTLAFDSFIYTVPDGRTSSETNTISSKSHTRNIAIVAACAGAACLCLSIAIFLWRKSRRRIDIGNEPMARPLARKHVSGKHKIQISRPIMSPASATSTHMPLQLYSAFASQESFNLSASKLSGSPTLARSSEAPLFFHTDKLASDSFVGMEVHDCLDQWSTPSTHSNSVRRPSTHSGSSSTSSPLPTRASSVASATFSVAASSWDGRLALHDEENPPLPLDSQTSILNFQNLTSMLSPSDLIIRQDNRRQSTLRSAFDD